ncbi:hypothetical protein ACJVDH_13405 [Pedobacter sp. AW1-32]|uniref:hypothetical protein n=1 Tax=Pedobacter sp. AW1-32 TaxID=3383026 RepID=UPI003FED9A06
MSSIYEILYLFESPNLAITEIKRLDLAADADISDVYHWLYLDKKTGELLKLWFRSMDSSMEIEERYFEQGYLKFNHNKATFIEKYNSAQHNLDKRENNDASAAILASIHHYLGLS